MRFAYAVSLIALLGTVTACSPSTSTSDGEAQATPQEVVPAAVEPQAAEATPPATPQVPQADGPVRQANDPYYVSAAASVAARADGRDISGAKNVILFIGDGMGISTITAARIYAGQAAGVDGESYQLAMDTLPHMALSKTYSNDTQVADSASTATAMVTGVKTNSRTLGLTSGVRYEDCASEAGQGTDGLFALAERAGLATGIITTTRITHATPAAAYAQTASRNWEIDREMPEEAEGCHDIARQLIEWGEGDGFEIALGGGRRGFITDNMPDPEDEGRSGRRTDGRDLTGEWTAKSDAHTVVYTLDDLNDADIAGGAKVLGLFEQSHMEYELDRAEDTGGEPDIEAMTRLAINRLAQDEDGYVLMVEGGRIDHAHHGTNAARALSDAVAFDQAVAAALELTDASDTLIIVTADHSHTMTIAGYPQRNNPILGKVTYPGGDLAKGEDGLPYTTLGYMNGPAACQLVDGDWLCDRSDLTGVDTGHVDFQQQALVPMSSETHGGEDVAVFARGPGSELVSGVIEQNEIFHIMTRANGLVETD